MSWHEEHERPAGPRLDDQLRSVLGGADEHFDYDALVAGTKVRATRIRRRRAVAQGATVAVLVPALLGAGFAIHGSLEGRTGVVTGPAATGTDGATATEGPRLMTSAPVPDGPPHQDPADLPDSPVAETNPDLPNRWEVPDPRPTGIDLLDDLGAPRDFFLYPRTVPLMGMHGDEREGVEPHSGASWSFHDGTNDLEQVTVHLNVTGWDDSRAVMAALRADEPLISASWPAPLDLRPWPGHHDDDHLLVDLESAAPWPEVGALVRQGDYLVGVSVQAETAEEAADAATTIAEQAAANLAYLDPDHGTD